MIIVIVHSFNAHTSISKCSLPPGLTSQGKYQAGFEVRRMLGGDQWRKEPITQGENLETESLKQFLNLSSLSPHMEIFKTCFLPNYPSIKFYYHRYTTSIYLLWLLGNGCLASVLGNPWECPMTPEEMRALLKHIAPAKWQCPLLNHPDSLTAKKCLPTLSHPFYPRSHSPGTSPAPPTAPPGLATRYRKFLVRGHRWMVL